MDGAILAAGFAGLSSTIVAVGTLIAAARRDSPENVKALRQRVVDADERAERERTARLTSERRADGLEARLYATEALVHRLRLVLARHGILVDDVDLTTPPGGIPAQRAAEDDTGEVPQP